MRALLAHLREARDGGLRGTLGVGPNEFSISDRD